MFIRYYYLWATDVTFGMIDVRRYVFLSTFPFYYFLSRFEVKTTQSAFKFNVCTKPAQPVSQNTLSQLLTTVVLKYFDNFANWISNEHELTFNTFMYLFLPLNNVKEFLSCCVCFFIYSFFFHDYLFAYIELCDNFLFICLIRDFLYAQAVQDNYLVCTHLTGLFQ